MGSNTEFLKRMSLNQITTEQLNLEEAVQACTKAEVPWISLWRHKIEEIGLKQSKKLVKDAGLQVSSLCRGGMFPAATKTLRKKSLDENRRAVEEAAELGTDVLVLVCGSSSEHDIEACRGWVNEGIEELVPFAASHGVKLGIEPLHPMYAADRSVVVTLGEAMSLAEKYAPDQVGVVVDVFHVWWDSELYQQIERAEGRILGFHVSDWNVPITDTFKARKLMGDGVIDIPRIRAAVEKAGYQGPIEVEIMNEDLWNMAGDEVLATIKDRFVHYV
ncbi:sugar phosphate isomerase/epimerase family protein [Oceanobacillus jordanicus]|uniref:Sugar phosphate isomerase/epimerase n=1 Tax=Oceanobacillus jordanicus TaxID=2867266 RepID=A0AAW5B7N1_9BACI|nr:sugar phosphate isomerase/epimerase family protein [Oceanobacillus jordanicus]MCG3419426.1 sugar phosphate isomerase/epimerase [Oceanobacillus jordanicus]